MMGRSRAKSPEHSVLYKAIFRRIPVPVALVDRDLVVEDASEAYARLAGAELPSLLGAPLAVVFPNGDVVAGARSAAGGGAGFAGDGSVAGGTVVHVRVEPIDGEARGLAMIS